MPIGKILIILVIALIAMGTFGFTSMESLAKPVSFIIAIIFGAVILRK